MLVRSDLPNNNRRKIVHFRNTQVKTGNNKAKANKWSVNKVIIKRGDIFYADLRPVVGSEQGGVRPVLIIQNDTGNKHSPTVICAAIKDSVILLEQIRTIDKTRLKEKVCHLDQDVLKKIDKALLISFSLDT